MKINPSRPFLILAAILVFSLLATPAMALVALTIDPGDSADLDVLGSMNVQCDDVEVNGTLYMGSGTLYNVGNLTVGATGTIYLEDGTIYMSGDWVNNGGTVDATTNVTTGSLVEWSDTATNCGTPDFQILGDSEFYNLTITTTTDPGRKVTFGDGDTTTVHNNLIMTGTGSPADPTKLLKIDSTTPGEPAFLVVDNNYTVMSVDVKDNHATLPGLWIDPDYPNIFNSIDSGGNLRWFRSGEADSQIRFRVTKIFTDGNPNSVTVHLACNAGTLAIQQSPLLADGTQVTFTVYIAAQGDGPYCRIWEEPVAGYTADYEIPEGGCDAFTVSCDAVDSGDEPGCFYNDAFPGDGDALEECRITNTPKPSTITVSKTWIVAGGDAGFDGDYKISFKCHSPIIAPIENAHFKSWDWVSKDTDPSGAGVASNADQGDMEWEFTLPHPSYLETCTLKEEVDDSIVSIDLSGCGEPVEERRRDDSGASSELAVGPGENVECAIINTAFFEGIPTLSPFGMAIMALLMLGFGVVGFRRLV